MRRKDKVDWRGEKRVFIVAEAGINHNGNFRTAKKLIDSAKRSGADAIKFQTYITEKRVKKNSPIYSILKKCELSFGEQRKLSRYAARRKLFFFSTPFDEESVKFLASIKVKIMKVASFDIVNKRLLKKIAATRIPTIVSRGMANTAEVQKGIGIFKRKKSPFALLHCVSSYPLTPEDSNLATINFIKQKYNCPAGYSDHSIGINLPSLAVAAGARIIEKHFTLNKNMKGPDHKLSADPKEFREMTNEIRRIEKLIGKPAVKILKCEKPIAQYRRISR